MGSPNGNVGVAVFFSDGEQLLPVIQGFDAQFEGDVFAFAAFDGGAGESGNFAPQKSATNPSVAVDDAVLRHHQHGGLCHHPKVEGVSQNQDRRKGEEEEDGKCQGFPLRRHPKEKPATTATAPHASQYGRKADGR